MHGSGGRGRSDAMRPESPSNHSPDLLLNILVGRSLPMARLRDLIRRAAPWDSNVLIEGESGTGKELVARAIHRLSQRARLPFIAENCAALPDGVVESELFGHVRGAFTGAERDRTGLIELANGGTLFLDEIGDLGQRVQAKLLRVIQEGEFRPVGAREAKRSNFRVIAATHRDLAAMGQRGEFREDLYYRLHVIHIRIPPLRARVDDIPSLVEHTLVRLSGRALPTPASERSGRDIPAFVVPSTSASEQNSQPSRPAVSAEAMEMLVRYPWPGNVRELQNVVEAALVHAGERRILGVADLPERILDHALSEGAGVRESAPKPHEQVMIEMALHRFRGDKTRAAAYIGWTRTKLYRVMARYGIPGTFGREGA
jgi:DNA-binding NtrC family response regulator